MQFLWTTITVRNMEESLEFYQNVLSLPISSRMQTPAAEIVFLGDGETKIELIHHPGEDVSPVGKNISIGLSVENLDDYMTMLKEKGIPISEGPFSPNPSIRFCFVHDPNGVRVQFVERN
ncbi:VOC family protein [uncultured Sphaerochaeta sp.]|uniref:VOC family protein n=1 Tax=uncultured Sphaerochaeta sp. TaxID=886478 RepID=UPI0029C9EE45|nr:VOC family protein [uncultured Sphaerochaeta sp.]